MSSKSVNKKSVGSRKFKKWLKDSGYDLARASKIFRVSKATISYWQNGINRPSYRQMMRIGFNANISVHDWHTSLKHEVRHGRI